MRLNSEASMGLNICPIHGYQSEDAEADIGSSRSE